MIKKTDIDKQKEKERTRGRERDKASLRRRFHTKGLFAILRAEKGKTTNTLHLIFV